MKYVFCLVLMLITNGLSAQITFELSENLTWEYSPPVGYVIDSEENESENMIAKNVNELISVYKDVNEQVNKLSVVYGENYDLNQMATEVYVMTLVDYFRKSYNDEHFQAEVDMSLKVIANKVFYIIRSEIRHLESNYKYISDLYIARLNDNEFSVNIVYDNDEDKFLLEESFYDSRFYD